MAATTGNPAETTVAAHAEAEAGAQVTGPAGPVTVLYVGGCGRSGSTLLDRMLGALPDFVALGEVVHLVARGLVDADACECGRPFRSCPFWGPVIQEAFELPPPMPDGRVDPDAEAVVAERAAELLALQGSVDRNRFIGRLRRGRPHPATERYNAVLGRLYRVIAERSGARVVVDSSKHASTAFVLRQVPGIDLRVVHLVRDSRGMAYSWTKAVARPGARDDQALMHQHQPYKSASRWVWYNALFHVLAATEVPTTRVIYEDLVADPRRQLDRILDGCAIDVDRRHGFLGDGWVELAHGHSVAGNPMRGDSGRVELRVDRAWRDRMPAADRRTVTAITLPLLAAYGYLGRKRR